MADMQPTHDPIAPEDSEFDLRARAELALAYEPGQPPVHLFRRAPLLQRRGVQRVIATMLLLGSGAGGVLAMRPPALVRGAIEHEHRERMLRGSFMDPAALLQHLGLDPGKAVPGSAQLMRPCDIDGRLVYHLTTFFDKAGMVTVFAFDQPAALREGSGWWGNAYWQVVTSHDGKPLVLVAESRAVLARAQAQFARPA
jgi:hypothetical protein